MPQIRSVLCTFPTNDSFGIVDEWVEVAGHPDETSKHREPNQRTEDTILLKINILGHLDITLTSYHVG